MRLTVTPRATIKKITPKYGLYKKQENQNGMLEKHLTQKKIIASEKRNKKDILTVP